MTEKEGKLVINYLHTKEGKKQLREAMQQGCARAADQFPVNSLGMHLARHYAGLPFKIFKKE